MVPNAAAMCGPDTEAVFTPLAQPEPELTASGRSKKGGHGGWFRKREKKDKAERKTHRRANSTESESGPREGAASSPVSPSTIKKGSHKGGRDAPDALRRSSSVPDMKDGFPGIALHTEESCFLDKV